MPRTLIYSRAQAWVRFSLNDTQLERLPGLPAPKRQGVIEVDMPVAQLRRAACLARGKDPGPPSAVDVIDFCRHVLCTLGFTGSRPWLSERGLSHRFLLDTEGKLYRLTLSQGAWVHPELMRVLRPIAGNADVAVIALPKPVQQVLAPADEDGALAVLYTDGSVMALTIWGFYDQVRGGELDETEYVEEFHRLEYDARPVSSIRFVFPDLMLQTDAGEEEIRILPSGAEQC